jgi:transposase
MAIVGGLDLHREQITFDCLDTVTGEVQRGRIVPADREGLASWLAARFAGVADVELAVEGCTGWRYVVEECARAGVVPHLAEPADTAALRGRKRHAKTDAADARHLRETLAGGGLPECWIPPAHILEGRALLELYQDLRGEHTAWAQRAHAVLFHQGAPRMAEEALRTVAGKQRLEQVAAARCSPAAQRQIAVASVMLDALEEQITALRADLHALSRSLTGSRVLAERLYGVGPMTGLALCCWLAGDQRFSSARKAVRFAGLDVTVHSSAGKRGPGRLSRQGPAVLRWCLYEAGKAHARPSAPDHAHYAAVKDSLGAKRAALTEARVGVSLQLCKPGVDQDRSVG